MYLIVESWLPENDKKKIGDLKENGYEVLHTPRKDRLDGGILCLHKKELNVKKLPPPFTIKTMEFMETLLSFRSRKVRFVTIYRPETPSVGYNNHYTCLLFIMSLQN